MVFLIKYNRLLSELPTLLKILDKQTKSSRNDVVCFLRRQIHASAANQAVIPFKLSDIGEGIREVVIKEWFVKPGDKVNQFDDICEVQSDKASVTITSRYDGTITKLCHKIDETVLVGDSLIEIDVEHEAKVVENQSVVDKTEIASHTTDKTTINLSTTTLATPAVRRIAKENQINLKDVISSGKDGRVLKEDLIAYLDKKSDRSNQLQVGGIKLEERTEPIKGYSKAMFKTMTDSLKIPHFVYSDEIKVTKLIKLRLEVKEEAIQKGYKLTLMPFFIKAISNALLQIPILNASIDDDLKNIIIKPNHNIGVAMDTSQGLVVPNIKSVQTKNILEIATDLVRLQECGRKCSFNPTDLSGGTFTLSNIGTVGGTYTKPVILPPEVVIGAIGIVQVLPRYNDSGEVVPEHIMNISWAADHRIIDGVTMAKFSNIWKQLVENPNHLLLNL